MIVATVLSIILLLIIQFLLHKNTVGRFELKWEKILEFIKNIEILDLTKELLIIFIGAFIALYVTNYSENLDEKEKVIKLFNIASSEISTEYAQTQFFLEQYDAGSMEAEEVYYNINNYTGVLENLMDNDIVMVTLSAEGYARILNDLRILNDVYDRLMKLDSKNENVITYVKMMNSHCENLLFAMEIEEKYLNGQYSEKDIHTLYSDYISDKYIPIDETQIEKNNN